jgi:hypothetical protein
MTRPKKKAPKIAAALLKKYDHSVTPARVIHRTEGESGPVRQVVKDGKPSGETLPVRASGFRRTFYRKAGPSKVNPAPVEVRP